MEETAHRGVATCCALIEIDHFKKINDNHGHIAGDRVLKTAIDFFTTRIRKYDIIFRYGGDEFLLMLPETNVAEATQLLERICQE